ncbi:MAG: ABC transporter ATP-binding protein/permease [Patescibacteria group bacterium]|nr:ABC transporter ATP-binding protein/permease [Patescibacteria group bacterium]
MFISYLKRTNLLAFLRSFNKGFGEYKLKIIALAGTGFLSALLEGIGINAFIPIFALVTGNGNHGDDLISRTLAQGFNYFHIEFRLKYLLFLVIGLFIFKTIAVIVGDYLSIKITADYSEKTRRKVFKNTIEASWPYLLKQQLGHLNTAVLTNVDYSEQLLNNFGGLIVAIASLIMYSLVAINISLPITILTILAGFFFIFLFKPLLSRTRRIARQAESVNRDISHHINENLLGMKTVKAMAVDDEVIKKGFAYFATMKVYRIKAAFFKLIPPSLMQPLGLMFVLTIFGFTYRMPGFNIAALAVVVYIIQRIFIYVQNLQRYLHVINDSYPYFKAVQDFSDDAKKMHEYVSSGDNFIFKNELSFKNVRFEYGTSVSVLKDVSFSIKRGEMVGLIGPSGSGKTTIVDLLLRLFIPTDGLVTVDGKNANDIDLIQWRKNIGYVPQDIFIINDTIANNISFYDKKITKEDIKISAQQAYVDDFISELPDGYDTVVGERGVTLSQGQRQRIIIARILVRKPSILVLDEATSALDNESETRIQKVIEDLRGKLTVIVIAHRLSTIMNTDKIIALEDGKIIEEGTPDLLLKNANSYFHKMHNLKA